MAGMEGASGGLRNEPNVVPMIDVLLVLLIIFMMTIPMSRRAIDLQLPDPKPPENNEPPPKSDQIVLEVLPGPQFMINKAPVSKDGLGQRIKEIFDPRPDKIMFVKGDPAVTYQEIIYAMDEARGGGVKVIGIPPKGTAEGGGGN